MSIATIAEQHVAATYAKWIAPAPSVVVMQPTTLCNLDCRAYCYLPLRKTRNEMPVAVAASVAASLATLPADADGREHVTEVCWHGGEPLALGPGKLAALLAPFEPLRSAGRIRHSIQTNGTLINNDWCDLLTEHGFSIGVSIDGPPELDSRRTDWRGRPAHDRIMTGIDALISRGIDFSLIAVVGEDGIGRVEELLDFLAAPQPTAIGINIEEFEGMNTGGQPDPAAASDFWTRTIAWSAAHPGVDIRELDRLVGYLRTIRIGERADWEGTPHRSAADHRTQRRCRAAVP